MPPTTIHIGPGSKRERRSRRDRKNKDSVTPMKVAIASPYQSRRKNEEDVAIAVSTKKRVNESMLPPPLPMSSDSFTSESNKLARPSKYKIDHSTDSVAVATASAKVGRKSYPSREKEQKILSSSKQKDFQQDDKFYTEVASKVIKIFSKMERDAVYDEDLMDQTLPNDVAKNFIKAIKYRMDALPTNPDKNEPETGYLTRKCHSLGLGSSDAILNPILSKGRSFQSKIRSPKKISDKNDSSQNEIFTASPSFVRTVTTPTKKKNQSHIEMRDFQSKYQQHEDKHTNYRDPINKSDESEQDQEDEIASKLHDASKFMAQSNTEQAVSFWKKQVMHLQGKLKSIQSKRKKKVVPLLNFKPNEECDTAHNSENPSCNYVSMQENGTIAKPTFANMGTDPIKQNINQRDSFSMKAIYPRSYSRAFERQIKNDLPIINVISPANLPSGYTFEAGMGNKKFLALVPFGGTKKGEIFSTPMISLDTVQIPVPIGRWRDHFCHLFVHGICHPLVFCSLFFPQIGLGQILTRNHLDWLGHDGTKSATKNACASITTLYLSWLVINALAMYVVVYENWYRRGFPPQRIDYIIMGVLNGIFVLYTLYAVSCARRNIRKKYAIEENVCIGCEDCCCATFCTSCSIAQMGRHTGNFDTIRAVLCSKTGIPSHVDVTPGPRFDDVEEGNVGGGFVQMK